MGKRGIATVRVAEELSTKDRLIDAALKLFAEHGYGRTTVGEIEAAAGLAPRSGALYKHFATKRQVLEAALERHVRVVEAVTSALELMPLGDLRAEITLLIKWALREVRRNCSLLLILEREAEEFPDLVAQFRDRLVKRAYRDVSEWSARVLAEGGRENADAEALTAIMLGAIFHYEMETLTFGEPPAGVPEERFVAAVVDLCTRYIDGGADRV